MFKVKKVVSKWSYKHHLLMKMETAWQKSHTESVVLVCSCPTIVRYGLLDKKETLFDHVQIWE
jgi:hypothetical protein